MSFVWTGEEGPPLAIAAAMSIRRQWSHPSFLSYFFSLLAATKIIYFLGHNERDFFFWVHQGEMDFNRRDTNLLLYLYNILGKIT